MQTQTSRRQALVVVVVLVGLVWVVAGGGWDGLWALAVAVLALAARHALDLIGFWPPRDDEPAVTLDLHRQADETTPAGPTAP